MPNYSVSITAFCTVVVKNARSAEEATELACEEVHFGSFKLDTGEDGKLISDEDLESCIRHADEVIRA